MRQLPLYKLLCELRGESAALQAAAVLSGSDALEAPLGQARQIIYF